MAPATPINAHMEAAMTDNPAREADSTPSTPVLKDATRQILKATLVPLQLAPPDEGRAVLKHSYLRQLVLQPGEVEAVRRLFADFEATTQEVPWDLLASFEAAPTPSLLPSPARLPACLWGPSANLAGE